MSQKKLSESLYGYCPFCRAPVILRERRLDGDDTCENEHVYPSRLTVELSEQPVPDIKQLACSIAGSRWLLVNEATIETAFAENVRIEMLPSRSGMIVFVDDRRVLTCRYVKNPIQEVERKL